MNWPRACVVLWAMLSLTAAWADAPYPPSPAIAGVEWQSDSTQQFGLGSDQWPMTWAGDGHLYAAWGDGWGWTREPSDKKRSIGVTRIVGDPETGLNGVDLWGAGPGSGFGKPEALLAVDDDLYMFWTSGDSITDTDETHHAHSSDNGETWSLSDAPTFPDLFPDNPNGFRVRSIVQHGKGYEGAPDDFAYVYFGFNRGSDLWLARTPTRHLFDIGHYEWSSGEGEWSDDFADAEPAFTDPSGFIWHVGVSYHPVLKRYLLVKPHYCADDNRDEPQVKDSGVASLGIFDATTPWGPWTTVFYQDNFIDDLVKFSYMIPTKFLSDDGKTFWLAWSGWPEYDNVNFVRGVFVFRD